MPLPPLCPPGPPLSREQITRYSRHVLLEQLGRTGQRRLRGASVLVMGAGGLGAPILAYLGAAGVATIGVVDDDVVEITNLQRQVIHTSAGVGRAKVDSAADFVGALNDDVQIVGHHLRMDESNALDIIGDYDLVLDGTDNFPTRYLVSDTCAAEGIPLIWGSILRFNAQVSVFWSRPPADARRPDGEPYPAVTLRDLFPVPPPEGTTPSCGEAGVLGAMCGQVGSLMAAEAIKLITGIGEPLLGRVAVLDVLAARWHEVPLRPAPARHAATAPIAATVPSRNDAPSGEPAPEVTARQLADLLAARERGEADFTLLDVREATEREIAVIPGAVSLPLGRLLRDPALALRETGVDPSREVVVHCLSGPRSAQAQSVLREMAIRATNVTGGIRAWATDVDTEVPTY